MRCALCRPWHGLSSAALIRQACYELLLPNKAPLCPAFLERQLLSRQHTAVEAAAQKVPARLHHSGSPSAGVALWLTTGVSAADGNTGAGGGGTTGVGLSMDRSRPSPVPCASPARGPLLARNLAVSVVSPTPKLAKITGNESRRCLMQHSSHSLSHSMILESVVQQQMRPAHASPFAL